MLSNSWSIYHKTFASRDRTVLRAVVDRKSNLSASEAAGQLQDNQDDTMGHHRSRRPTSSDSGYDTNSDGPNSPSNERIRSVTPQQSPEETKEQQPSTSSSELDNSSLLSTATRSDLGASIGTQLSNIQLSTLTPQQLDELAVLVSERGVVFLRDQDLTAADQLRIFEHYGATSGKQIIEKNRGFLKVKRSATDHGENFSYAKDRHNDWVSDRSFEVKPPSYSFQKADRTGGETVWVSQYGLYDSLSKPMKGFLDQLEAVHTSSIQYDSIANLRGFPPNRAPVEIHHPAVRTHPVTGWKALNVNSGSVKAFADLSKGESNKLLELLDEQLHSSDEHTVHFKWETGSVAIWDNRCTVYRSVPGLDGEGFKGVELAVVGEKPYFDPKSESRNEKVARVAKEAKDEREKLEGIKARFNNTPLRRILRKQTNGPAYNEDTPRKSSKGLGRNTKSSANGINFDDSVIVIKKNSTAENGRATKVEVSSKGSPLRRIIQRQASGNVAPRRRERLF
ncbi:hypothetical protein BKA66DRAFT_501342 [Pyrenochaeta sp. MPI-SDFR-AT-0127]|nr:hypothetical protein BKA66DRAFT_501342 [Pyrenochaeta sp. MPI-SDFR-AT-0127]